MTIQGGGGRATTTQTTPEAARAAAEAARAAADAQRAANRALADNIREQVRTSINAATQAEREAQATQEGVPVPPVPPFPLGDRTFRIRGPNGEQTVIGIPPADQIIPPQAVDISIAFFLMVAFIIVGLPIARAFGRRMDRKGGGPGQIPREVTEQLTQINQAVDAIALEVERISEGQRYTTRLLSEQHNPARQTLPSAAER